MLTNPKYEKFLSLRHSIKVIVRSKNTPIFFGHSLSRGCEQLFCRYWIFEYPVNYLSIGALLGSRANSQNYDHLGTGDDTKTDEFSEKVPNSL